MSNGLSILNVNEYDFVFETYYPNSNTNALKIQGHPKQTGFF